MTVRKRIFGLAAYLLLSWCCGSGIPETHARDLERLARYGINVENPQRLPVPDQERLLDALVANDIRLIRAPLAGLGNERTSIDPAIDFVIRASRRGIRTTLGVFPSAAPEVPLRPKNPAFPNMWSVSPLSRTSPEVTRAHFADALARLEAADVVLAGIEVGNEINWTAFNGDFPVPGTGRVYGYDELVSAPEAAAIASGLRVYVDIVRAVRAERDASRLNRAAPIVSAGLADPGPPRAHSPGKLDAVAIPATLRYLKESGLDDVVDAYGVHTYPGSAEQSAEQLEARATRVFGACGRPPDGKPCWLTEWGIKSNSLACGHEGGEETRAGNIKRFMQMLKSWQRSEVLTHAFYYQWRGETDLYGMVRCGHLTAGGRAVLEEMGHR